MKTFELLNMFKVKWACRLYENQLFHCGPTPTKRSFSCISCYVLDPNTHQRIASRIPACRSWMWLLSSSPKKQFGVTHHNSKWKPFGNCSFWVRCPLGPYTFEIFCLRNGPLAQWIRRRPPEPEIPGSSPGRINFFRSCWKTTSAYISAGFCSCTCESIAMSVLIAFAYVMRWLAENFPKRILGFFVELLVNNERVYNTGYSSVGRASDCRFCRHQMLPGSIPGGRICHDRQKEADKPKSDSIMIRLC